MSAEPGPWLTASRNKDRGEGELRLRNRLNLGTSALGPFLHNDCNISIVNFMLWQLASITDCCVRNHKHAKTMDANPLFKLSLRILQGLGWRADGRSSSQCPSLSTSQYRTTGTSATKCSALYLVTSAFFYQSRWLVTFSWTHSLA